MYAQKMKSPANSLTEPAYRKKIRMFQLKAKCQLIIALFLVSLLCNSSLEAAEPVKTKEAVKQEYYEIRIYRIESKEKHTIVSRHLEIGLIPALNRQGINRVGVFTVLNTRKDTPQDHSIYMLIPYQSIAQFTNLNSNLAKDEAFQKTAKPFFNLPAKESRYTRIDSSFLKAFAGMPVIEMPIQTKQNKPRLFELRTYESKDAYDARMKVEMFNTGEIQLMRDVKMAPVFYGEMLIGKNVPNLTYMLSADDMAGNKAAWKTFINSPVWGKMKNIPKYKTTVSKIEKWYLISTSYSGI